MTGDETDGVEAPESTADRGRRRATLPSMPVLLAGVATTAITLLLLYLANQRWPNFQPMGFYLNLVIPLGAIGVGLLAGSGYGIASWVTGTKIGGLTLCAVFLLQVWAYFAAQQLEYRALIAEELAMLERLPDDLRDKLGLAEGEEPEPVTFWEYFDETTRSFCFTDDDGEPGPALGAWGYLVRFGEVVGFSLGALIAPALLMAIPYCEDCRVYMKSKELGLLPAGIEPRKIKRKDEQGQADYEKAIAEAIESGRRLASEMLDAAERGESDRVAGILAEHRESRKEILKATSRTIVSLQRCPRCEAGDLIVKIVTGSGEKQQELAAESRPVGAAVVRDLIG